MCTGDVADTLLLYGCGYLGENEMPVRGFLVWTGNVAGVYVPCLMIFLSQLQFNHISLRTFASSECPLRKAGLAKI